MTEIIRIPLDQMEDQFRRTLINYGFESRRADECGRIFASNSLDGISSHGVNRFARFVHSVKDGYTRSAAMPEMKHSAGAIEQWDGGFGPGPLNAVFCTERSIALSRQYGIGCVAIGRTNHWMRAGYYGWLAAKKNCVLIAWTNTIANMPAWGALDCHLGNNPVVLAAPYGDGAIVLDAAMSQFSYGALESYKLRGNSLPYVGGFDEGGNLTTDPASVLNTQRLLPIGYWKGAGMALLFDVLSTILSDGLSTREITRGGTEHGLSQVFIAVDTSRLGNQHSIPRLVNDIILDYKNSVPASDAQQILYPGERVGRTRRENLEKGIPVDKVIWDEIVEL